MHRLEQGAQRMSALENDAHASGLEKRRDARGLNRVAVAVRRVGQQHGLSAQRLPGANRPQRICFASRQPHWSRRCNPRSHDRGRNSIVIAAAPCGRKKAVVDFVVRWRELEGAFEVTCGCFVVAERGFGLGERRQKQRVVGCGVDDVLEHSQRLVVSPHLHQRRAEPLAEEIQPGTRRCSRFNTGAKLIEPSYVQTRSAQPRVQVTPFGIEIHRLRRKRPRLGMPIEHAPEQQAEKSGSLPERWIERERAPTTVHCLLEGGGSIHQEPRQPQMVVRLVRFQCHRFADAGNSRRLRFASPIERQAKLEERDIAIRLLQGGFTQFCDRSHRLLTGLTRLRVSAEIFPEQNLHEPIEELRVERARVAFHGDFRP